MHHNSVKVWTFDNVTKKLKNFNCALGKITRYIICLAIDDIDEFAFCGTRSGDVLEVSLTKGIYSRSGPLKKKFTGAVNQVLCKDKGIYVGTSEGVFAKLDKTHLTTSSEVKFLNASVTGLAASQSKVYSVTQRGDIRAVLASEPVDSCADFMTSNQAQVASLTFPGNYCNVFATSSMDEIRLWSPDTQKELLRIELMQ